MIYQELGVRILYKKRAEKYTLVIENDGPFVIGGIRLSVINGITEFSDDFTCDYFELLPHEKKVIETSILLKYSGSYEAGITEIVLYDVFRIIRMRYHIPAPLRVHVLPTVTDMADIPLNRILDEMVNGRRTITRDQREDTMGII